MLYNRQLVIQRSLGASSIVKDTGMGQRDENNKKNNNNNSDIKEKKTANKSGF